MKPLIEICHEYLEALRNADSDKAKALFEEGAKVKTPIFGTLDSNTFFDEVKFDTIQANIHDVHIYQDEEELRAAIHFNMDWTLKNGSELLLEIVDILQFNHNHKIISMNVIYDTVDTRQFLGKQYVE